MGNYIYRSDNFIVSKVVCKTQYMQRYVGNSTKNIPYNRHYIDYNGIRTFEYGVKTEHTPEFDYNCSYVVVINDKYTVYIGYDEKDSKMFVDDNFPIGGKFTVTEYLNGELRFLSTDKTLCYLWPLIQN